MGRFSENYHRDQKKKSSGEKKPKLVKFLNLKYTELPPILYKEVPNTDLFEETGDNLKVEKLQQDLLATLKKAKKIAKKLKNKHKLKDKKLEAKVEVVCQSALNHICHAEDNAFIRLNSEIKRNPAYKK
jgi:hypothetical protein